MPKPKVIRFDHGPEWQLRLTPKFLQQDAGGPDPEKFTRRVRRTELRKVFQTGAGRLACSYPSGMIFKGIFPTTFVGGILTIGCQTFTPDETQIIQKWAVGKKKK